jgi:hypothetical protein
MIGSEIPTVMVMKSSSFWNITSCSQQKVNQHSRGTYCLNLQGQRVSQARNQHEKDSKQRLPCLIFNPEDEGNMFL